MKSQNDECISWMDEFVDRSVNERQKKQHISKISHSEDEDGDVFPFGNREKTGSDEEAFRKFEDEVTGKAFEKQLADPDDIFF